MFASQLSFIGQWKVSPLKEDGSTEPRFVSGITRDGGFIRRSRIAPVPITRSHCPITTTGREIYFILRCNKFALEMFWLSTAVVFSPQRLQPPKDMPTPRCYSVDPSRLGLTRAIAAGDASVETIVDPAREGYRP
jgi:hypothetical protein